MIKYLLILVAGLIVNLQAASNPYYKEQSGYDTSVQVIGSEKKFERIRFIPSMFSSWRSLFVEAKALSLIGKLGENGYINNDGTLSASVTQLSIPLRPNAVINKNQIKRYYKLQYPASWIFSELIRVGVLDKNGFLTNTDSFSDDYMVTDFDQYYDLIKEIDFNFSNPYVGEELSRELLRMLREASLSIHVTQEQTTRYRSRKEGFFESFLDQIGGNILGSIFFKDKIDTVKRKIYYTPNISVFRMFTNINTGFAKSTYYKGAKGDFIFYGLNQQRVINVKLGQNKQEFIGFGMDLLNKGRGYIGLESINSQGVNASYYQAKDDSSKNIKWASLRFLYGTFSHSNSFKPSIGLTSIKYSDTKDQKIGIGLGVKGVAHFMPKFGLYYNADVNFGFDLFSKNETINWSISNFGIGLQTGVNPVRLRVGYEWITEKNSVLTYDAFTTSLSIFF